MVSNKGNRIKLGGNSNPFEPEKDAYYGLFLEDEKTRNRGEFYLRANGTARLAIQDEGQEPTFEQMEGE